jgi:voltage-gated potassium channel
MIQRHHKLMMNYTRIFVSSLRRPVMVYLVSLAFTAQICFAGIFFILESGTNTQITNFFDALYFTVTVMTGVGLGDIAPLTFSGRILAMTMMLSGTAIYVCFTAILATLILRAEDEPADRE